jgi:hypothetical protein
MRIRLILFLIIISNFSFGQPNPRDGYPKRIKEITEHLKTDSLNFGLIWERLEMKIALIESRNIDDSERFEVFCQRINCNDFENDFEKVFENIIKIKQFDIVEEGDFYLNRVWFYSKINKTDKAIEDAIYLRDNASYSKYWERGEYYNDLAISSLFNLYSLKKDYNNALKMINYKLEKQKNNKPQLYYSYENSYYEKLQLFEEFAKKDEIILFLKQLCIENFNHYFEIIEYKNSNFKNTVRISDKEYFDSKDSYNYFVGNTKEQSFNILKKLLEYSRKYDNKEFPNYEKIYNQLYYQMNENYVTINPKISDEELKVIVSKIEF